MDTKEILTEAKNLINLTGWVRGNMGDEHSGYCVMGAIDAATSDEPDGYMKGIAAVKQTLKERGTITSVASWNDANHRTKDQVLELLDEAAARA